MYRKIVLPNGVRVVAERIDHVRSAAIGIWVGNGSRFEPAELGGISHFIEHMIFKGTEKRSTLQQLWTRWAGSRTHSPQKTVRAIT